MNAGLKRLLLLVGAGGLLAWGVYSWRESRDYIPAGPRPKRAAKPPQPIPSSREEQLPPPDRPLAELKQVDNGPGLIVCNPVVVGGKPELGDFGDGCSRWLDVVVSGQVEFGKSPTLTGRTWVSRSLQRPDFRIPAAQAKPLAKILGITHAVFGEIAPAGTGYALTYRLLDLSGPKPVGAPLRLTGTKQQLVAALPGAATELCGRLGVKSPQVPQAVKEGAAELGRLGALLRGSRSGPAYSKAIEKLGARSPIANLYFSVERGAESDVISIRDQEESLYQDLGANTLVYSVMARGQQFNRGGIAASKSLNQAKNNYLVQFGRALEALLVKDAAGGAAAAEQAVCCSLRSPEAWTVLSSAVSNRAGDLRRGRFVNQMTPAEMSALEPSYQRALATMQRAVQLDPNNDTTQLLLSQAATFGGNPKLAAQALWRSIALRKGNLHAYIWGLDLFSQKWYGDEKSFQKVVRMAVQDTYWTPDDRVEMATNLFSWGGKDEGLRIVRSPEERAAAIRWGEENQPKLFQRASATSGGKGSGGKGSGSSAKSTCLTQHAGPVTALAWSPDGNVLASAAGDATVHLWSPNHELHRELLGHTDAVKCVAWSPDGKLVASGGDDKTVRIWRAATGEEIQAFKDTDGPVYGLSWHPDGGKIAIADAQTLRIFDLGLGKTIGVFGLETGRGVPAPVGYSPDGRLVACVHKDTNGGKPYVVLWQPQPRKTVFTMEEGRFYITALAWSPDGKLLATGGDDEGVNVYDTATGTRLRQLKGNEGRVFTLAWSPDGQYLAAGDQGKAIRIWEGATGQQVGNWRGHTGSVYALAWNPRTGKLCSGGRDFQVLSWEGKLAPIRTAAGDNPTGNPLIPHPETFVSVPQADAISALALSPAGDWAAVDAPFTGPDRGSALLLDTTTGKELRKLPGKYHSINSLAVSADGRWVAGGGMDGVTVWDAQTGAVRWEGPGVRIKSVTFSPDGRQLAGAEEDERFVVWDAATGNKLRTVVEDGMVTDVSFRPGGKQLAVAVSSIFRWGDVSLWDPTAGVRQQTLEGHTRLITSLAYSADGKFLVSTSADGTARVWEAPTGKLRRTLGDEGQKNAKSMFAAVFGPNSQTLLTTDGGNRIRVWDLKSGLRQVIEGGGRVPGQLAFSARGKVLAVGMHSPDGKGGSELRIWRLP